MRIIIVGCGRLGSGLAQALGLQNHTVTVVDNDPLAFERLGPSFRGQTVLGVGFDRDVLLKAGIERADCLAAATASDDANIVAARMASQVFHVPKVVARLYDPRKAEIYKRLGLMTVSPIVWGINHIADLVCYSPLQTVVSLGSDVDVIQADAPPLLVGRTVRDLTVLGEIHVVAITRGGQTFLPTQSTAFQDGDLLHLAVLCTAAERLKELLASG
jgi:trk system potassium uptake protein TrkA